MQMLSLMIGRVMDTPGRADEGDTAKRAYIHRVIKWMGVAPALGHEWHEGRIWCPTTANGTWVMEHDGRVIITGNSKNTQNVARLVAKKPAFLPATESLRRGIETALTGDDQVDQMLRPDWMQEQQAMQVSGDEKRGTVFLLASWLPFQQLMDLFKLADSPAEFARGVMGQVRPDVKVFAEIATGTDIFRKRPVKPFTTSELLTTAIVPKAIIGRSGTSLDQLLGVRPLREAVRVATDMPSVEAGAVRATLGGAFQPLTRDRALWERYTILRDEVATVRREINQARAANDNAVLPALIKRWFTLQREMEELGLPGVAKATRAGLQGMGVRSAEPALPR